MARRWQVLLVTSVAVFMSFLDVTNRLDLADARERELAVVLAGERTQEREALQPEQVRERVLKDRAPGHRGDVRRQRR